jgi:hypothetical protein
MFLALTTKKAGPAGPTLISFLRIAEGYVENELLGRSYKGSGLKCKRFRMICESTDRLTGGSP